MKFIILPLILILIAVIISTMEKKHPVLTPEEAKKKLKEQNIYYSTDTLIDKVLKNDTDAVRLLLQAGLSADYTYEGKPLLAIAFDKTDLDMAKLLVESGIKKDEMLIYAVIHNNQKLIRFLLEYKADILAEDKNKKSLIELAVSHASEEVGVFLIEKNCYLGFAEDRLLQFASAGWDRCAEMVLEKKADINCKDSKGRSPLHYAVLKNHRTMVQLLIRKKADLNIQDKTGITPLMAASRLGYIQIVKDLLGAGADVSIADSKKRRAVHYTNVESIKNLLEPGSK